MAVLIGAVVVAVAVSPLVMHLVDWGMDDELTPGQWEPHHWFRGAVLSTVVLGSYAAAPLALLVPIVVAFVVARRTRANREDCPSCGSATDMRSCECPRCGVLPPRRPGQVPRDVWTLAVGRAVGFVAFVPLVLLLSSGISWVILEREEDAFGERARAAAAAGAGEHWEYSTCGSVLSWSKDHGYSSHRD